MPGREWTMAQGPDFHRQKFVEFAQLELDTGGPDPHMDIITHAGYDDMPWLVGLYVARYTVASAVAMFHAGADLDRDMWWNLNLSGLPIRRERRAVYSLPKMRECLRGLYDWIHDETWLTMTSYEELWKHSAAIPYFGRYARIKLLEGLRRAGYVSYAMPDIRPGGAWSPILTLNLMQIEPLPDKSPSLLINAVAEKWRLFVQSMLVGHELDYFRYETLLCNYRQALEGKYPGRPHDTELKYWIKAEYHWGTDFEQQLPFREIRARLFNPKVLGELRGWDGPREDLEDTIVKYGYFWSDLKYDYQRSKDALIAPVPW